MSPLTPAVAEETIAPDEAAVIQEFIEFLKEASLRRSPTGPVRRFNQGRATACVDAILEVNPDLSPELRVGLFAQPAKFRAYIRFANASSATDRDKDVRGMSISVLDVPGTNLTEGATTQDFVLNSHPVMVAPDTREFMALLKAMEKGGVHEAAYFVRHPRAAKIGLDARQHPTSHLDIPFWSTTPYLFGPRRAVKYFARPSSATQSSLPKTLTDTYLHDAMAAHLSREEATFDFTVQFQGDPARMPIEDATVEWDPQESPYASLATVRIPRQEIDARGHAEGCEAWSFNPWNCLLEHRPLGSMNRARREIYRTLAQFRRDHPGR